MNSCIKLAFAMATGAVITGAVDQLRAQPKPGVYVVVEVNEVKNSEVNARLLHKGQAVKAAAAFGGHFVVRTENISALDGVAPKRFLLLEFDSVEKAEAWNASPAMAEVNQVRIQTTNSRSFVVGKP